MASQIQLLSIVIGLVTLLIVFLNFYFSHIHSKGANLRIMSKPWARTNVYFHSLAYGNLKFDMFKPVLMENNGDRNATIGEAKASKLGFHRIDMNSMVESQTLTPEIATYDDFGEDSPIEFVSVSFGARDDSPHPDMTVKEGIPREYKLFVSLSVNVQDANLNWEDIGKVSVEGVLEYQDSRECHEVEFFSGPLLIHEVLRDYDDEIRELS